MQSTLNWSVDDVVNFLHHIGITEYDNSFVSNHINGQTLLLLTCQELKNDLGIKSLGHRKQILKEIDKLRLDIDDNADINQYAMTACISAALSSILIQHNYNYNAIAQTDNNKNKNKNIIHMAVSMATEAAQYILHNQQRISNVLNTNPNPNPNPNTNPNNVNILKALAHNSYSNCRKRIFPLKSNHDPIAIDLTAQRRIKINGNNDDNNVEAKRSNRAWSDCDERELIKLKSLATFTWNRIGEYLQRTGAACQLHWKTMKNLNTIKSHIQYIKSQSNNNDKNYNKYDNDHVDDIALLISIDKVLKTNAWHSNMLDVLYNNNNNHNIKKEIVNMNNEPLPNTNTNTNTLINHININHIKQHNASSSSSSSASISHSKSKKSHSKSKKDKKCKKHKKKKHHHHHHHHRHHHKIDKKNKHLNNDLEDIMIPNGYYVHGQQEEKEEDDNGRSSRSNARWTGQEEDTLIKMMAQSNSLPDIATKLGRSIAAINQHRLAMKHKHAKSLNDSSDNESAADNDSDDSSDDDNILRRQQSKSNVVLTPIITPTSYVSPPTNRDIAGIPSYIQSYGDPVNVSSTTTTTTTTTTATATTSSSPPSPPSTHSNTNNNPFKCMPVFNVHNKRSLSAPNYLNANNVFLPPNKKARLSNELLPTLLIKENTNNQNEESIALPSLNASFQST